MQIDGAAETQRPYPDHAAGPVEVPPPANVLRLLSVPSSDTQEVLDVEEAGTLLIRSAFTGRQADELLETIVIADMMHRAIRRY